MSSSRGNRPASQRKARAQRSPSRMSLVAQHHCLQVDLSPGLRLVLRWLQPLLLLGLRRLRSRWRRKLQQRRRQQHQQSRRSRRLIKGSSV